MSYVEFCCEECVHPASNTSYQYEVSGLEQYQKQEKRLVPETENDFETYYVCEVPVGTMFVVRERITTDVSTRFNQITFFVTVPNKSKNKILFKEFPDEFYGYIRGEIQIVFRMFGRDNGVKLTEYCQNCINQMGEATKTLEA